MVYFAFFVFCLFVLPRGTLIEMLQFFYMYIRYNRKIHPTKWVPLLSVCYLTQQGQKKNLVRYLRYLGELSISNKPRDNISFLFLQLRGLGPNRLNKVWLTQQFVLITGNVCPRQQAVVARKQKSRLACTERFSF